MLPYVLKGLRFFKIQLVSLFVFVRPSIPQKQHTMNMNSMNSNMETSGPNYNTNMASNNRNDDRVSIGEEQQQQIGEEQQQQELVAVAAMTERVRSRSVSFPSWGTVNQGGGRPGRGWGTGMSPTPVPWSTQKKQKISTETLEAMEKRESEAKIAMNVARENHERMVVNFLPQWREHHKVFDGSAPVLDPCFDERCKWCYTLLNEGLEKTRYDVRGEIAVGSYKSSQVWVRVEECSCCPRMKKIGYGGYGYSNCKECQCPICLKYCHGVENKICDCSVCRERKKVFKGIPYLPDWLQDRLPPTDDGDEPQGYDVPNEPWTDNFNNENNDENSETYWKLRDGLEQMEQIARDGYQPARIGHAGTPRIDSIVDLVGPENRGILDDDFHPDKGNDDFVSTVTLSCLAGQSPDDIMYMLSLEERPHEGSYSPNHGIPSNDGDDGDDTRNTLFNVALQCNAEWRLLFYILAIDPWAILKLNWRGETVMHQAKLWRMDGRAVGEVFCCVPVSSLLMDSDFEIPMHKKPLADQSRHTSRTRQNRFGEICPAFPPFYRDSPWSGNYANKVNRFFRDCADRIANQVLKLRLKHPTIVVNLNDFDQKKRSKHIGNNEIQIPAEIFIRIASFTSPCSHREPAHVAAVHLIFTQRELIQLHHAGFGSHSSLMKANGYRSLAWKQEHHVTHYLPQYAQNSL
jgi:hypothetical protein